MDESQNSVKQYIKRKFRVHVFNADTHEDFFSSHMTGLQIFLIFGGVIISSLLIAFASFVFTPLKYTIPGYGKNISERKLAMLSESVSTLENQVRIQDQYIRSVRSLVSGKPIEELLRDSINTVDANSEEEFKPVPKIEEDSLLRKLQSENKRRDVLESTIADKTPTSSGPQVLSEIDFISPVKGKISKNYDDVEEHFGVDIVAPKGSAIKSVLDGVVIYSGYSHETGYTLIVQHANNIVSSYKHNSKNLKSTGEKVKAGEAIAIIGNTGKHSTGPHLHFELWSNNTSVAPEKYIRFD